MMSRENCGTSTTTSGSPPVGFVMPSKSAHANASPPHTVRITPAFLIASSLQSYRCGTNDPSPRQAQGQQAPRRIEHFAARIHASTHTPRSADGSMRSYGSQFEDRMFGITSAFERDDTDVESSAIDPPAEHGINTTVGACTSAERTHSDDLGAEHARLEPVFALIAVANGVVVKLQVGALPQHFLCRTGHCTFDAPDQPPGPRRYAQ